MPRWKVEVVQRQDDNEELDYLTAEPGPAMRSWLRCHTPPLYLRVSQSSSHRGAECPVRHHSGCGWRAQTSVGFLPLEAAVEFMKDQLEAENRLSLANGKSVPQGPQSPR